MNPLDHLGKLELPDRGQAPDGSRWVIAKDAARILGIPRARFDELVNTGRLDCFCPAEGRRVVSELDLLKYLDRHRQVRSNPTPRMPGEFRTPSSAPPASGQRA